MPRLKPFGRNKFKSNRYTLKNKKPKASDVLDVNQPGPSDVPPRTPSRISEASTHSSSSKKKLKYLDLCTEDTEYIPANNKSGNIIIDLSILNDEIVKYLKCRECDGEVELCELSAKRNGLSSQLNLSCKSCDFEHSFYTSRKVNGKLFDVNLRCVYGFRSIGKGKQAANMFCSLMNLPKPPSRFQTYSAPIYKSVKKVAEDCMVEAAHEAKRENGDNPEICAAFDGSWQKRGHQSLNGVFTATSVDTGKVLDIECLSKFCAKCKNKPELEGHENCQKNFEGASGGMEVAGAVAVFQRSEASRGLKYTQYLGDGDSKAFKKVLEAKPYGDTEIKKLECVGHIQKRMGARLRKLKSDFKGKKCSDGKPLSGRNRLTDAVIDQLQTYYGQAIRNNLQNEDDMRKAVWAIYFHKLSTDDDPQHGLCPKGTDSWCKYQRKMITKEEYSHKHSIPAAVMAEIKPTFRDLSNKELLQKCLHGRTQNPNESINSMIWNRLPKTVFVGLESLKIGALDAVISFNTGDLGKVKVLEELCGSAGNNCVCGLKAADSARVLKAEAAVMEVARKARERMRNLKRKKEDQEGDCDEYGAGLF